MLSRRKRQARLRSVSTDGSRAGTPQPPHASQRPSAARRALLMGYALEKSSDPIVAPPERQAFYVQQTPGGSVRCTGATASINETPGGHLRVASKEQPQALCSDVLERVEALDLTDEEVEDVLQAAPWHVRRWVGELPTGHRPNQLSLEATAEKTFGISNVPCIPNVSSAYADIRPSTSGVTAPSLPAVGINQGSDFDSEFDDEFDVSPVETNALNGVSRDIPVDDELDQPVRDIVESVQRAMDEEIDRLPGLSSVFQWEVDFDSFRGVPEQFSGPEPGPIKDYDSPYDAFTDIWSKDIIERIAQETNRYARQTIDLMKSRGSLKPSSRLHKWSDTDSDEVIVFFAILMYMGIDLRTSQNEYWKGCDYLEMAKFKSIMSYNRYILMNKFLHFVDNCDVGHNSQHNEEFELSPKLAKIAPVLTHLDSKFSSLYNMQREISIDESLTLFKGRLSWVQTIRSKAARFGIKSYELCESRTGYLYKFRIYTGKNDVVDTGVAPAVDLGGKSTKVVLDLLKDLQHRGHCVTMDNFYNCPSLARYLKSLGCDCLGTLRSNRKNVPADIAKVPKNVAKGTIVARHSGDVSVLSWKDSKVVTMISTYHTDETYVGSKAGKTLVKPVSVRDYNNTMGGVDLKDQKLSMYLLERKRGVKWYIKIFKRLMNASIHNAFILYTSSCRRRSMQLLTHREFRYVLAKSLVDRHRHCLPEISEPVENLMRLRKDVMHEPAYECGNKKRKRCFICYRQEKTKLVHSQCVTCEQYLCFGNCWREWHSLPEIKGQEVRGRKRKRVANE